MGIKVIIPAAGIGKRLRPHTHTVPKALLFVAGKTILEHILDNLKNIEIDELILITGYKEEQIKSALKNRTEYPIKYITQKERNGLGHAIYTANEYVNDGDEILIILGDSIINANIPDVINKGENVIGVKEVHDPWRFGIVEEDNTGYINNLIEKPAHPVSNMAIIGLYYFAKAKPLFDALDYVVKNDIKTRGEYQLTDALSYMLREGHKMRTYNVKKWFDCGTYEVLIETNRVLLESYNKANNFHSAVIIPPVYIDDNVKIENSVIGPYVSIASGSIIEDSILRDSILNKESVVKNMLLDGSIVGTGSIITGKFIKLNIGDSSEIDFN